VILSMHIADVGSRALAFLHGRPRDGEVPGLRYAEAMLAADLTARLVPAPRPGRVGLLAAWGEEASLERFLAEAPQARGLAGGWQVRLQPLRAFGSWRELPDLPLCPATHDPAEPVAVLTLGRLRLGRLAPFLRASARAEGEAARHPALLAGTALARPPRLVCTFSLWRSAQAMREYAAGNPKGGHPQAVRAHARRPFHRESVFVRLRPYASSGTWEGRDPLALTRR
jgi:hypothetical protein